MIRHVIFDLDGTLVDSCAICVAILSDMLDERGSRRVIDPAEARNYMSCGGVRMVSALLGPDCGAPEAELAEFRARYQRHYTPPASLFPGVAEGLADLQSAGLSLAICSNKPQALCDKVLVDTGLAPFFTSVVGGRPGLRAKPHPDLLRATLAELGNRPGECIFVGDSELDHVLAQSLAMPFLLMTYGYAEEGWEPGDCSSFDSFRQMAASLLSPAVAGYA